MIQSLLLKKLRLEILPLLDGNRIALIEILAEMMSGGIRIPGRLARTGKKVKESVIKSLEEDGLIGEIISLDPSFPGYIYESLLEQDRAEKGKDKQTRRRRGGIFYTPQYITQFLVKSALDSMKPELKKSLPRIHDPACGGGAFLLAAYREIKKRYPRLRIKTILGNLYGTDSDREAIHVAHLALWLESGCKESSWKILESNIRTGDSLKKILEGKTNQFEIVVGNPPYRNVKRGIQKATREFCKANYRSVKGQWDIAAPFIELAMDHLLIPGGSMGYILPNPILLAENYQPVREIILENDLVMFGPAGRPFEEPGVEASLLVVRKGKSSRRKITILDASDGKIRKSGSVKKNLIARLPFLIFSHLANEGKLEPVLDARDSGKLSCLGDFVKFTRGIECGKSDERVIRDFPKGTSGFPLAAGEALKPYNVKSTYRFTAPSHRIGYKDLKSGGLWSGTAQLLLRRVADRPIAAVASPPMLVLNTIYVVQAIGTCEIDPYSVSALFNSTFFRDLFRQLFSFDDRLFPYLRTSQLARIPVPKMAMNDVWLSMWSSELHEFKPASRGVKRPIFESLHGKINERVENLYQENY